MGTYYTGKQRNAGRWLERTNGYLRSDQFREKRLGWKAGATSSLQRSTAPPGLPRAEVLFIIPDWPPQSNRHYLLAKNEGLGEP